jgi:hypothetical protein
MRSTTASRLNIEFPRPSSRYDTTLLVESFQTRLLSPLQIVKERQMEFDMETDPDALFELFGDDARSFAE